MNGNINNHTNNKYNHNSTNYQSSSYELQPHRSSSILSKKKSQKLKQHSNYQHYNSNYKESHTHKQTLQQLQHLMLHSENAQFIIDDPKLYCICRNGIPNQNSLMVMCQNCQEWFHIQCIGIKKHQAKSQDKYFCVACKSLEETIYQQNLGYFWDHFKKISEYSLVYIYDEGKNIGAITNEQKKIQMVYNAMIKWKQQTNKLLNKILEDNPLSLKSYEQEIYPLYLQSIWLPTVHYESIYLKRLMKNIRGL